MTDMEFDKAIYNICRAVFEANGGIVAKPKQPDRKVRRVNPFFRVEKVIANGPATIVIWKDGTKTVVKCQKGDTYNLEAGIAMCFMKRALGDSSRLFNDVLAGCVEDCWREKEIEAK